MRVGAREVSVSIHGDGGTALVLFHGAGGNRRTPFLVAIADALAAEGHRVLLANFPYTEDGRKVPDKPEVLEAAVDAVATHAERALGARRVILGGKSMGGRMASQLAAKGRPAAGLVFLGYPLHPPGREETLRDAHLGRIRAPMLFLQGTRDDFARWELIEAVARRLGPPGHPPSRGGRRPLVQGPEEVRPGRRGGGGGDRVRHHSLGRGPCVRPLSSTGRGPAS